MKNFTKKFSAFLDKIVPPHARFPLIALVLFNMLVYYGSSVIVRNMDPSMLNDLSTPIDDAIPFFTPFITIYILAYVHWFVGYIVLTHGGREHFFKVATAEMIAKALCLLCFLLIPTTIARPAITDEGFFGFATSIIYSADKPLNLFPSIHCLESWVVFRGCLKMNVPKWYKIIMGVFAVLVFASVVFVKQHFFLDIPAGILVFEIGLLVTKYTKLDVGFSNKLAALRSKLDAKKLAKAEHSKEKEYSIEK